MMVRKLGDLASAEAAWSQLVWGCELPGVRGGCLEQETVLGYHYACCAAGEEEVGEAGVQKELGEYEDAMGVEHPGSSPEVQGTTVSRPGTMCHPSPGRGTLTCGVRSGPCSCL